MKLKFHLIENLGPDQHRVIRGVATIEEAVAWLLDGDATKRGFAIQAIDDDETHDYTILAGLARTGWETGDVPDHPS